MPNGTCGEPGPYMTSASPPDKASLRRELRRRRVAISAAERRQASRALLRRLRQHPVQRRARHIAVYAAHGSELSLHLFIDWARRHRKQLYFPRIRGGHLDFIAARRRPLARPGARLAEPDRGRARPPWALQLVLMPLVGFDAAGHRLGQGGGYYDRWLARPACRRPVLLGIAFDCQQVEALPADPWDAPLDGIITPTRTLEV